jgi:hypothetical protein
MTKESQGTRTLTPDGRTLRSQIREAIASRGWTAYAAGRRAGVDPGVVKRYLKGERDVRTETADRLAAALSLRLVGAGRAKARPRGT